MRLGQDTRFTNEQSVRSNSWAAPMNLTRVDKTLRTIRAQSAQYTLVPAACGESDGFVEFQLGDYTNVGVGSIFPVVKSGIRKGKRKIGYETCKGHIGSATVPLVPLRRLLDA